ncbi:MAG: hypothetical protein JWP09_591 [Candidatus Taylorbacteria bacterium]|nr:hypothetical protein [Candidatus Taylorbacteria bacterium]
MCAALQHQQTLVKHPHPHHENSHPHLHHRRRSNGWQRTHWHLLRHQRRPPERPCPCLLKAKKHVTLCGSHQITAHFLGGCVVFVCLNLLQSFHSRAIILSQNMSFTIHVQLHPAANNQTMKFSSRSKNRGFTRVELLVCICLISCFAALTYASIHNDDPNPRVSRACAVRVLTTYASARTYGVEFKAKTPGGIIQELVRGVKSPDRRRSFSIPLDPEHAGSCSRLLYMEKGELRLIESD